MFQDQPVLYSSQLSLYKYKKNSIEIFLLFILCALLYLIAEKLLIFNATGHWLVGKDAYFYFNLGKQYLNGNFDLRWDYYRYGINFNVLINALLISMLGDSELLVIFFKGILNIILIGIPFIYICNLNNLFLKKKPYLIFIVFYNPYLFLVLSRNWKDIYVIFGIILICIVLFYNVNIRKSKYWDWKSNFLLIFALSVISIIRIHITIIICVALILSKFNFKNFTNLKLLIIIIICIILVISLLPSNISYVFLHNEGKDAKYIPELQVLNYNNWENINLYNKLELLFLRWSNGIIRTILTPNPIKIFFDYYFDYSNLHKEIHEAISHPYNFIYQTPLAILSTSIYMFLRYLLVWPIFFGLLFNVYKKNWVEKFGMISFIGILSLYSIKFMSFDPRYFLMCDLFLLLSFFFSKQERLLYIKKYQLFMFVFMIGYFFFEIIFDANLF